jgi:hypothetical protein
MAALGVDLNEAVLAVPVPDNVVPGPGEVIPEAQPIQITLRKDTDDDSSTLKTRYEKLQQEHSEALYTIEKMKELVMQLRSFATEIAATATTDLSVQIAGLKRTIAEREGEMGCKRSRAGGVEESPDGNLRN